MRKLIALLLVAVPLCAQTRVAPFYTVAEPPAPPSPPVYDSISSKDAHATASNSWTHVIGTGDDRALLVCTIGNNATGVVDSVKLVENGGASHTLTRVLTYRNTSMTTFWNEVWKLEDPPSGTDTIKIWFNASINNAMLFGVSYSNVTAIDSAATATGAEAAYQTIAASAATNTVLIGGGGVDNYSADPGVTDDEGQTRRGLLTSSDKYHVLSSKTGGGGSTTVGWTIPDRQMTKYLVKLTGS